MKRLPGRRSEEDELGTNCVASQQMISCTLSDFRNAVKTYSMSEKWRCKMTGSGSYRCRRSRRERRGLSCALIFRTIIRRCHGCWSVSVWGVYACARWLAMCLSWRAFACAMWRRRGLLLHWSLLRCATIIVGTAVVNIAQFVRGGDACFFRWAPHHRASAWSSREEARVTDRKLLITHESKQSR